MSWLFGLRKDNTPSISSLETDFNIGTSSAGEGKTPSGGSNSGSGVSGNKPPMEAYRFDSSALERAAKAARELELSPNAKEYLDLAKMQEVNKQLENQNKMKEYEAYIANAKSEQIRVQEEERRKTIAEETKHNQMRSQYQDQLARKRYDDQLIQQQRANEENLRKQEESIAKQEAMRRASLEREMEIRSQSDVKKAEAKVRAQGIVDRENQDLRLEQIRVKLEEQRKTTLESLKTATSIFGAGFNALIGDRSKITTCVAGVTMIALGYFSAKYGTRGIVNFAVTRLSKPRLVNETSRLTLLEAVKHPIQTQKRLFSKPKDVMKGVIFGPSLEEKLTHIAVTTANTWANKGEMRNYLFYGPPGTGKTLFARRLAELCGMDYAVVNGGKIVGMGKEGVLALDKVFNWAKTSKRGLLLFIDEAEAFLRKRSSDSISEDLRAGLNSFLFETGSQSHKVMVVLATNTPEQIDWAAVNRMNKVVEFKLPGLAERERLIRYYFDQYILIPATEGKKRFQVETFDYGKICSEIAKMTEGFCGRQIAKLASEWQSRAYASDDCTLTEEIVMKEVHDAIEQHKGTSKWMTVEEARKQVMDTSVPRDISLN